MQGKSLETLDYRQLLQASKHLNASAAPQELKVALLSDAATQRFEPILRTLFHAQGVNAEIYCAPYDSIELEARDPRSGLSRFQPDVIVVLNSVQALRAAFCRRAGDAAFDGGFMERMEGIWEALQSYSSAIVLQSNFVLPYERFFGNFDQLAPQSLYATVAAINASIAESARGKRGLFVLDVEAVASWIGRRNWFDERFWDLAKSLCAQDCLPAVGRQIVDIVMAARGRVVKCVILDLDNTLWGGVIGDDGLDGIQLNAHGDGEAFYRLQCYLRELRKRGILLAVCSKNEMENALLPFEKHSEMALKRDDIAVFIANWNDKAENIRAIQRTLNIGFDSMVFLDDNPFERNLVRELLPEVIVPELPEDPADYVRAISELNLFETTAFSEEDAKRTELYLQEARRSEARAGFESVEQFLQSLEMQIAAARFDRFHLPRISQLMQRSNQFNLTTRRLSEAECEALMNDRRWIPLYAKLADRLGDHGLISVVILEPLDNELAIRDWLMSCRVLGRGVEQYLMNIAIEHARRLGLPRVAGEYVPTAKNGMVKEFFAQFGFRKTDEKAGVVRWVLEVEDYRPASTFLREAMAAESAAH